MHSARSLRPREAHLLYHRSTLFALLALAWGLSFVPANAGEPLHYRFSVDGVLEESGRPSESSSPYWWLNSGGQLHLKGGIGSTIQGALAGGSLWQRLYAAANPLDTDEGTYPQNLFRLISKQTWGNPAVEVAFRISRIHTTDTPNRGGFSGILLMSRYHDGDNLYYAGIRMDGKAVIKKKRYGSYTTLAEQKVFPGSYDLLGNPNLIPTNAWMRLKSVVRTTASGVSISLYLDRTGSGAWEKILAATDTTGAVPPGGSVGIRTDYLDAYFDDFKASES